jgi:hypothetical protein
MDGQTKDHFWTSTWPLFFNSEGSILNYCSKSSLNQQSENPGYIYIHTPLSIQSVLPNKNYLWKLWPHIGLRILFHETLN